MRFVRHQSALSTADARHETKQTPRDVHQAQSNPQATAFVALHRPVSAVSRTARESLTVSANISPPFASRGEPATHGDAFFFKKTCAVRRVRIARAARSYNVCDGPHHNAFAARPGMSRRSNAGQLCSCCPAAVYHVSPGLRVG